MKRPLYNFSIYQGADEMFPFTFYISDGSNETPVDLNGCSFLMSLRQDFNKPVVDVLTSDNGRILIGTIENGMFVETSTAPCAILVKFPHEITTQYIFPSAVYDLFKIDSQDYRELLLQGTITINKSVCYGKYSS